MSRYTAARVPSVVVTGYRLDDCQRAFLAGLIRRAIDQSHLEGYFEIETQREMSDAAVTAFVAGEDEEVKR